MAGQLDGRGPRGGPDGSPMAWRSIPWACHR